MTPEEAIGIVRCKANLRTRYEGQEAFLDEVLVAEIERLQNALNADSQAFQIECQKAEIERLERVISEYQFSELGLSSQLEACKQFLRTCVDKMIDYEVDDTVENADFIVDCAAAAGPYPDNE